MKQLTALPISLTYPLDAQARTVLWAAFVGVFLAVSGAFWLAAAGNAPSASPDHRSTAFSPGKYELISFGVLGSAQPRS